MIINIIESWHLRECQVLRRKIVIPFHEIANFLRHSLINADLWQINLDQFLLSVRRFLRPENKRRLDWQNLIAVITSKHLPGRFEKSIRLIIFSQTPWCKGRVEWSDAIEQKDIFANDLKTHFHIYSWDKLCIVQYYEKCKYATSITSVNYSAGSFLTTYQYLTLFITYQLFVGPIPMFPSFLLPNFGY